MNSGNNDKKPSVMAEVGRGISMILQIGISMMVPVFLCLFIGYELDKWLDTKYWTFIFIILGIMAGFKSVYSMTKSFYSEQLKKENETNQYYANLYNEREKNLSCEDDEDTEMHL